jgi:DNA-binding CsgD family transcriptional regulator
MATKEALGRLRRLSSNTDLADRIPVELCHAGFSRVLFSRIERNTWVVRSAHIAGDAGLTDALLRVGRAHPRRLCRPLPESAMVRDKAPILIPNPQSDPRVNADLVAVVKPDVYVAAPVYVWQSPVALLHADAQSANRDVDTTDRDLLGLFAEGLGAIMERNIISRRLQGMRTRAQEHIRDVLSHTDLFEHNILLDGKPEHAPTAPPDVLDDDIAQHFTRRERQVLDLMAAGKTNAQIASWLFVSEGTVKSHVRHIMQKLQATNRTDAVVRYQLRLVPRQ